MLPRPELGAVLLVTWPGGARSFHYDDYWSGPDLIYTGRGKRDDQRLEGANLYLAENRFTNYVFEGGAGSQMLRFLGEAVATNVWRARGFDELGNDREILRYRLRFGVGGSVAPGSATRPSSRSRRVRSTSAAEQLRQRRPFDPTRAPAVYRTPVPRAILEETTARREKAGQAHHALLERLHAHLLSSGWSDINEIPSAIDLEATRRDRRVLFEAKTVSPASELSQTRAGLSQLLEYRFFYGRTTDRLCLVTDAPISDRRIRFLEAHDVAVAYDEGRGLVPSGTTASELLL
jgi:hypothetical protein